jgi:hypothetical protein
MFEGALESEVGGRGKDGGSRVEGHARVRGTLRLSATKSQGGWAEEGRP